MKVSSVSGQVNEQSTDTKPTSYYFKFEVIGQRHEIEKLKASVFDLLRKLRKEIRG